MDFYWKGSRQCTHDFVSKKISGINMVSKPMFLRHFMYPNKFPVCVQAAHKIPLINLRFTFTLFYWRALQGNLCLASSHQHCLLKCDLGNSAVLNIV